MVGGALGLAANFVVPGFTVNLAVAAVLQLIMTRYQA
jgi:hypothetical protein